MGWHRGMFHCRVPPMRGGGLSGKKSGAARRPCVAPGDIKTYRSTVALFRYSNPPKDTPRPVSGEPLAPKGSVACVPPTPTPHTGHDPVAGSVRRDATIRLHPRRPHRPPRGSRWRPCPSLTPVAPPRLPRGPLPLRAAPPRGGVLHLTPESPCGSLSHI